MRKSLVFTILLILLLTGCGGNEGISKDKEKIEYIDGFEVAEYEKFNSYASENGLEGTLIVIEGTLSSSTVIKMENQENAIEIILEQEDGNKWAVAVPVGYSEENIFDSIENKEIRAFGTYAGYTDVFNLPSVIMAVDSEDKFDKVRIEVYENGEYTTAWDFTDYIQDIQKNGRTDTEYYDEENSELEDSNLETIDTFQWYYDDENYFTISLCKDKVTGEKSINAFGDFIAGNENIMSDSYIFIYAISYTCEMESNIIFGVGEDSYMSLMNDGKLLINTFPDDISDMQDIPESYFDSIKEMHSALNEFFVKNGIMEKTYNQLVYEDENVKIYFSGIDDYGVNFNVENLTDKQLTIQADSIAINGESTNNIVMSDDIAPYSTGKAIARCNDFYAKTEVERISGVLRIIGITDLGYDATFSNITVE